MHHHKDFVKATTTSEGTGDIELGSSPSGFKSFAVFSNGQKMDVLVVDNSSDPTNWEVFEATYNTGTPDTLTRGTFRSSDTGSRVNFPAGTKTVVAAPSAVLFSIVSQTLDSNLRTSGSAGTYTVTTVSGLTPYDGYPITVEANHTNPAGGCTLNPDGTGAVAIKLNDGTDPYAGAIQDGGKYDFQHDGTVFQLKNPTPFTVTAKSSQIFTAGSYTYNKPTGCRAIRVRIVGGGGGGGAGKSFDTVPGAGGGGGGYCESFIVTPDSSYSLTVGSGGAGAVPSTSTSGQSGGNSAFGGAITASGGSGGGINTDATTAASGAAGGAASGGTFNIPGSAGHAGMPAWFSGRGGDAGGGMGGGGASVVVGSIGNPGAGYGAGGGGSYRDGGTDYNGGAGAGGICIVEEYY